MGEYLDRIEERIHAHLRQITADSGLPDTPESLEEVARAWLEKNEIFEEKTADYHMQSVEQFAADESRGALALTWSGSLVAVGPIQGSGRERSAAYSSIGLRKDVPGSATHEAAVLAAELKIDEPITFSTGPVQKTSAIYRIAVSTEQLPAPEEHKKLMDATEVIASEFVEVNKTIVSG